MEYDFDLFVIGGGSGGVRAARLAAQKGKRVGMAEGDRMGGTCVIRGCVPKKLMLFASDHNQLVERADNFGWETTRGDFDWPHFQNKLDAHVNHLEALYTGIAEKNGIRLFHDYARLDGPNHVVLNGGARFSAERILIATGGKPSLPSFEGSEYVITSDDAFAWDALPKSIIIVGGGYIASEFAGIFNGLNVKTTQIYRGDLFLRGYDVEMRERLRDQMRARGVDLRKNTDITKIEIVGGMKRVTLNTGETLDADEVMYAIGRIPNTDHLDLDAAGVKTEKGAISVDAYSQTNIPSIYAVGDVTGRAALTPVAIREAVNFVKTVYDDNPSSIDYGLIPTAIFTRPEFATIGLSEEAAREQFPGDIVIFANEFTPMQVHFGEAGEKMLAKLVVRKSDDKMLGVHIMGETAGEMIQFVGVSLTRGITKTEFDSVIAVHPTQAEELVTMSTPRPEN